MRIARIHKTRIKSAEDVFDLPTVMLLSDSQDHDNKPSESIQVSETLQGIDKTFATAREVPGVQKVRKSLAALIGAFC